MDQIQEIVLVLLLERNVHRQTTETLKKEQERKAANPQRSVLKKVT